MGLVARDLTRTGVGELNTSLRSVAFWLKITSFRVRRRLSVDAASRRRLSSLNTMVKRNATRVAVGGTPKTKAMQNAEKQAAKAFVASSRLGDAAELKAYQKYCHEMLDANASWAPHVRKWFVQGYFDHLVVGASCTADTPTAEGGVVAVHDPAGYLGDKLKGRVGKMVKISVGAKRSIVRMMFALDRSRDTDAFCNQYFGVVLQLTEKTPKPTSDCGKFEYTEPLAKAFV